MSGRKGKWRLHAKRFLIGSLFVCLLYPVHGHLSILIITGTMLPKRVELSIKDKDICGSNIDVIWIQIIIGLHISLH